MSNVVLLPVESGDDREPAVRYAIDLAADRDATLYVLGVVDRRRHEEPGLSSEELVTIETEDANADTVAAVVERAASADVEADSEVCHGIPQEEILAAAADLDADVIVLGAIEGGGRATSIQRAVEGDARAAVHVVGSGE